VTKIAVAKTKKNHAVSKINGVDKSTLTDLVNVFKSLSDLSRLQILLLLAKHGDLHVKAICDELAPAHSKSKVTQPAVSHHLTQLKHAGLVTSDRDGKFNYYKLESGLLTEIIEAFFPQASAAQQKVSFGDLEVTFKTK
jgi:ArsR family transcriptional regulator